MQYIIVKDRLEMNLSNWLTIFFILNINGKMVRGKLSVVFSFHHAIKKIEKFTVELLLRDAYVSDTFSIKLISLYEINIFHSYTRCISVGV